MTISLCNNYNFIISTFIEARKINPSSLLFLAQHRKIIYRWKGINKEN